MAMQIFKSIRDWFSQTYTEFNKRKKSRDSDDTPQSERIVVFIFAFMIALSMWLLVNLGRDYNLTMNLPILHADAPEGRAFITEIPRTANTTVSGEGWKLITIYNNPPPVVISTEEETINIFEAVQASFANIPDVSVTKVQPMIASMQTEEELRKRVPVVNDVNLEMRRRYHMVGDLRIAPDSITIRGARSLIEPVEYWATESRTIEDVRDNVDIEINLRRPHRLIQIDTETIRFQASVAEFTEGEARIPITTQNLPAGRRVTFSPAQLTVRYDVPIDQYSAANSIIPFLAYVPYRDIVNDTTGFVIPVVEPNIEDLDVRLRSHQPRRVSYFNVVVE